MLFLDKFNSANHHLYEVHGPAQCKLLKNLMQILQSKFSSILNSCVKYAAPYRNQANPVGNAGPTCVAQPSLYPASSSPALHKAATMQTLSSVFIQLQLEFHSLEFALLFFFYKSNLKMSTPEVSVIHGLPFIQYCHLFTIPMQFNAKQMTNKQTFLVI